MSRRHALDLFNNDGRSRWRIVYASMFGSFLMTLFALKHGASPQLSLVVTAAAGFLLYLCGIYLYVQQPRQKEQIRFPLQADNLVRPFSGLAAATLATLIIGLETPTIAAAALNRRLQLALQIKQPDKRDVETRRILSLATQSHTVLRPGLVMQAKKEIDIESTPPAELLKNDDSSQAWVSRVSEVADDFNKRFALPGVTRPPMDWGLGLAGTIRDISGYGADLRYDGHARLYLDDACFKYVKLTIADTENGRKLLDAFEKSKDGCVSVHLERVD